MSGASERANERMDERVAQYLRPDSWQFCPKVELNVGKRERKRKKAHSKYSLLSSSFRREETDDA